MYQLYDKDFKIGFAISTVYFLVENVKSYFDGVAKYKERRLHGPSFSGNNDYFPWGYPFEGSDVHIHSLNIVVIALCGFLAGLTFRFISQKISKKN